MLHNHEITSLIRDTEPHERGLFSVDPAFGQSNNYSNESGTRRKTTHSTTQGHSSTVARVLGSDMLKKIQSSTREGTRGRRVDVEVLLQGAEKLCSVYDVPGTADRVNAIRTRYHPLTTSITQLEDKLVQQQSSLPRPNLDGKGSIDPLKEDESKVDEETLQKLEEKKMALEARLAALDKDLGGLRG